MSELKEQVTNPYLERIRKKVEQIIKDLKEKRLNKGEQRILVNVESKLRNRNPK